MTTLPEGFASLPNRTPVFAGVLKKISALSSSEGPGFRLNSPSHFDDALASSLLLLDFWQALGPSHFILGCKGVSTTEGVITFNYEETTCDRLIDLNLNFLDVTDLMLIAEGVLEALLLLHNKRVSHNNLSLNSIRYDPKNKLCQLSDFILLCNQFGELLIGDVLESEKESENTPALFSDFSLQIKTDLIDLGSVLQRLSQSHNRTSEDLHLFSFEEFVRKLLSGVEEDAYLTVQPALDSIRETIQNQSIAENASHHVGLEFPVLNALSGSLKTQEQSQDHNDERTIIYDSTLVRRVWNGWLEKLNLTGQGESELLKISVCLGRSFDLDTVVSLTDRDEADIVCVFSTLQTKGLLVKYRVLGKGFCYRFRDEKDYDALCVALAKLDDINIHQGVSERLKDQYHWIKPEFFSQYVWHRYKQSEGVPLDDQDRIELIHDSCKAATYELSMGNAEMAVSLVDSALNSVLDRDCEANSDEVCRHYKSGMKTLLRAGEFTSLLVRAKIYLRHNPSSDFEVIGMIVDTHTYNEEFDKAISVGLKFLTQLGLDIPKTPSTLRLTQEFVKTRRLLQALTQAQLSALPRAIEPNSIAIYRVLASLISASMTRDFRLTAMLSFIGIQHSLKHGVSVLHSTTYLYFGWISMAVEHRVAIVGHSDTLQKCLAVSANLENRFITDESIFQDIARQNTLFLNGYVRPWQVPLLTAIEGLKTAAIKPQAVKPQNHWDDGSAVLALERYGYLSLAAGVPLDELEANLANLSKPLSTIRVAESWRKIEMLQAFISQMHHSDSSMSRAVAGHDDSREQAGVLFVRSYLQAYRRVLFSEWESAWRELQQARNYLDVVRGQPVVGHFIFLETMVGLQLLRRGERLKPKSRFRIYRNKIMIKKWADQTPDNFYHWSLCVQALSFSLKGANESSEEYFKKAVDQTRSHHYSVDCALIAEMAATVFEESLAGRKDLANLKEQVREYRKLAYRYYERWGAKSKVELFKDQFPYLTETETETETEKKGLSTLESTQHEIETIADTQKTRTLFNSVLSFLLDTAGFDKLILFQCVDKSEYASEENSGERLVLDWLNTVDGQADYPDSIVQFVEQSRTDLHIQNETINLEYGDSPYIKKHNPLTIACYPIVLDEVLIGLLYCESRHQVTESSTDYQNSINLIRSLLASSIKRESHQTGERTLSIAKISHDCIAPASAIIKYAEFALNTEISEDQRHQYIQSAMHSAESMLSMVKSLTHAGKKAAAVNRRIQSSFHLPELVNQVVEMLLPSALEKELILMPPEIDEQLTELVGDIQKIQQVIVNLLSNAIKYTQQGSVRIAVNSLGYDRVSFTITDTGVGIAANELDQIFKKYVRVDNPNIHKEEGEGLGLAICKELVEVLGGEINVHSVVNEGSRFQFVIPLEKTPSEVFAINANAVVFSRSSVVRVSTVDIVGLVVDDNRENAKIAQELLRVAGVVCDYVLTGVEAISQLRSKVYNFVLLDIDMPQMNGYQVASAIRKDASMNDVSVIAYTAGLDSERRIPWSDSGFNAYVNKSECSSIIVDIILRSLNVDMSKSRRVLDSQLVLDKEENTSFISNQTEAAQVITSEVNISQVNTSLVNIRFAVEQLGWTDRMVFLQVEGFSKRYGQVIEDLPSLIEGQDFAMIQSICHSLKSAAFNLGVPSLSELAKEIELEPQKFEPEMLEPQMREQGMNDAGFVESFTSLLQVVVTDCEQLLVEFKKQHSKPNQFNANLDEKGERTSAQFPAEKSKNELFFITQMKRLHSALVAESPAALAIFSEHKLSIDQGMKDQDLFLRLQSALDSLDFEGALAIVKSTIQHSPLTNNSFRVP